MKNAAPLTYRYKILQSADCHQDHGDGRPSAEQLESDVLYHAIVAAPVQCIADAIEKLAFADHCLIEEHDAKEASSLIRAVIAGLIALNRPHRSSIAEKKIASLAN